MHGLDTGFTEPLLHLEYCTVLIMSKTVCNTMFDIAVLLGLLRYIYFFYSKFAD
jgi:hypothetical protein